MLVGTKEDKATPEELESARARLKDLSVSWDGIPAYITSSKRGENVRDAFDALTRQMRLHRHRSVVHSRDDEAAVRMQKETLAEGPREYCTIM